MANKVTSVTVSERKYVHIVVKITWVASLLLLRYIWNQISSLNFSSNDDFYQAKVKWSTLIIRTTQQQIYRKRKKKNIFYTLTFLQFKSKIGNTVIDLSVHAFKKLVWFWRFICVLFKIFTSEIGVKRKKLYGSSLSMWVAFSSEHWYNDVFTLHTCVHKLSAFELIENECLREPSTDV